MRLPKMGRQGIVTATRTVWCGDCNDRYVAEEDSSQARAEAQWMGAGWCRFPIMGWLCPRCSTIYERECQAKYERSVR